ncbi:hypothetical protein [Streptomyces sp. NPDC006463]
MSLLRDEAAVVVPVLVRDLTPADLSGCTQSGSTAHPDGSLHRHQTMCT